MQTRAAEARLRDPRDHRASDPGARHSNIALRIRSLNPDLVIPSSYYNEFVLLARTMQQQRIRPKGVYAVLNGAPQLPVRQGVSRGRQYVMD